MKQCPNCGAKLSDDAVFCSYCGSRLETPPPEAAKTEPIPTNPTPANPFKTARQMADRPVEVGKSQFKKKGKSPRKKGRTLGIALIVLFLAILLAEGEKASEETPATDSTALSADSALMEPESSSVASSSHAESRAEKNGFDSKTNESYAFASYVIEIPSYWDSATENRINDGIQRYAETGGKVAMLQITAGEDPDPSYPVTFEGLMADNDNMIASIEAASFDTVTDYEVIDTGVVKGILYKGTIKEETTGISGYGEWFVFPSETDRNWCNIILAQTNNTDYSYTEDFLKMLYSIRPIQEDAPAANLPESTPYTTVENSADFAALMSITDQTDAETIKQYVSSHLGTVVEFDGCVGLMMHHADYNTRFDVAIFNGDYDGSRLYGPIFAFENVNFHDMNVSGTDTVAEGMNFRITGEIKGFNEEGCYIILDPVSMILR